MQKLQYLSEIKFKLLMKVTEKKGDFPPFLSVTYSRSTSYF